MAKILRASKRGATLVETPVALTIFFFFLLFPLIDLSTIALRCASAYSSATNAAHRAALAPSFLNNTTVADSSGASTVKLSAVNSAVLAARETKSAGLAGTDFDDSDVSVKIVGVPLKPSSGIAPVLGNNRQPLTEINPDYVYQIEVSIATKIQPLFLLSPQIFGEVPGLTVPLPLNVTSQQVCEDTSGLTR
ncbi:MAG: hypothetical protein K2X81_12425 [Candidatus Obscuribacterales bacterium]|nr:hypothetical protein [Candidatus Obscuribacterales bacterium]